ncbi:MAG: TetR/AcrR family transcriptional regulator [Actinobacteria bacterium]|nr:TetR/AcrR family transcriptional regulator [Actinomycetota bacterium]
MTPTSPATTSTDATASCTGARPDDPRVERTRAAVIEAAVELLMVDGPSAVTHANVASSANVSRTTVYKHWPTRADLLRSTIEALGKTAPLVTSLTGEVRADLGILFQHAIDDLADDQRAPLMAIMMERALHDPTVTAVRDELISEFEPIFQTIIRSAIETGDIRHDIDLDLAVASIIGSFLFIRFMSPQEFDAATAGRILDDFVSVNRPR